MATRTAHTFVASEVLTATNLNDLPKGWIGEADAAGPITVNTTADDIVSVTVTVGASRKLKVSARGSVSDVNNDSTDVYFNVLEGATDHGRVHIHSDGAERSFIGGYVVINGPTAAAHTYKVQGITATGDVAVASASILVEDIGPAS